MPYEPPPNQWGQMAPGSAIKLVIVVGVLIVVFFIINYIYYRVTHPKIEK